METTSIDEIKLELERMRRRLLDLSARNPLLNYLHPRAKSLRIVDEVPAIVLERMVGASATGFRFAPIKLDEDELSENGRRGGRSWGRARPGAGVDDGDQDLDLLSDDERARREAARGVRARREAKIAELARALGINPSFDLPAVEDSDEEHHGDNKLQTLLLPKELEARLQKMQAAAVTAIQESGANMLHLLFGFVEWTDVAGGKPRMAPLVLLPVTLSRQTLDFATHTFPYTVAASGEDWSTNVTLQEKCKRDFNFELPSIEPEENLEEFFSRVEGVLQTAAPGGWSLKRQLTLGLVSFGKILMWRDLDPATWPRQRSILDNPLLREVLGGEGEGDEEVDGAPLGEMRTDVYNIDRLPKELGGVPPIVVPADSSQHTVLVDVQRGDNLVVQGPPGTGKSQTITNIIANAIAAGKRILFVAEKKAALEVVARRLVQAGLGPFCLPLHSHTSNKREFLDGLAERLALGRSDGARAELQTIEDLLSETREVLTAHAERLNSNFGSLGDTVYSILWRARRLSSEIPEKARALLRDKTVANAVSINPTDHARQRVLLDGLASAHQAVIADQGRAAKHPWAGVTRANLSFDDAQHICGFAQDVRRALEGVGRSRQSLVELTASVHWPETTDALSAVLRKVSNLDVPNESIPRGLIQAIHSRIGEDAVRRAVAAINDARQAWSQIRGPWGKPGALDGGALDLARRKLDAAGGWLGDDRSITHLAAARKCCELAKERLRAAENLSSRIAEQLQLRLRLTPAQAVRLIDIAERADRLPSGALDLRTRELEQSDSGERISALHRRAIELTETQQRYEREFPSATRPNTAELKEIARSLAGAPSILPWLLSGAYRRALGQYRRMSVGKQADRAAMIQDVNGLLRYVLDHEAYESDPHLQRLFGSRDAGTSSPFDTATSVINWARQGESSLRGLGEGGRVISEALWKGNAENWREAGAIVSSSPSEVAAAKSVESSFDELAKWTRDDRKVWLDQALAPVFERLDRCLAVIDEAQVVAAEAGADTSTLVSELLARLVAVEAAWSADAELGKHAATLMALQRALASRARTDSQSDLAAIGAALEFLGHLHAANLSADLVKWLAGEDAGSRVASLKTVTASVLEKLNALGQSETDFAAATTLDVQEWYGDAPGRVTIAARLERLDHALCAPGSLARYATLLRTRAHVAASRMPAALSLIDAGALPPSQLSDAFTYLLTRTLAEMVLRQWPELDQFSGELHENRRSLFAGLDERFIELTQQAIADRATQTRRIYGNGYGLVSELTEEGLIQHEIKKTRRHVPIREMFRRAGRAIQALKPCIMMGPQAVAQYLPPGLFNFDLVVMDEASQMRPEDALGAIARSAQLVVVGDPKQLGPTSFFDTQSFDDDEVDEEAARLAARAAGEEELPRGASVLERSESILLATARRYPMRMLRWHYRSKYPQLISFSNKEFYGDDLVLFPHPGNEREGDGVNFRAVDGALYSASTNLQEAKALVAAVREHATTHPERTLLVVTMNQPQRDMIDTMIQEAEKDDPRLSAFRARHAETLEPFGVKNLENVQGDERDVIYVSSTYGPNERGTVVQHFGPINAVGGERRLNVLFTRAKYRLDVFCSFDPTVLRVTESSPRGLCVFRDYLRYAKEGTLAGGRFTGREPDSDFEIEVARAVRGVGYEVHAQIGVAGYFIDMAVVDPKRPGRYALGIECDGATYHSAKSARDRDRLRQTVLEGLGWQLHRIWSTDWYRDPHGETQKLLRRLSQD